jgi:uncharacterized protein YabN with tetrapyrrole methylase and pyrophosphatase domain
MGETGAQLSSVATSLDELTQRVTEVADQYKGTDREDLALELYEVERALVNAGRKLDTVVRRLT